MEIEPIEDIYFNWLCAKVSVTIPNVFFSLMRILHQTEFVCVVQGDKNRAEDGLELRDAFLSEANWRRDSEWYGQPASIFEVLIAFAHRASFQTDTPVKEWFWHFLTNLELNEYRQVYESDIPKIEEILGTFVWRTYDENGRGGLFPLRRARRDQREIEIWYQFCDYLEDQGLL